MSVETGPAPGEEAIDPVCGMTVERAVRNRRA